MPPRKEDLQAIAKRHGERGGGGSWGSETDTFVAYLEIAE